MLPAVCIKHTQCPCRCPLLERRELWSRPTWQRHTSHTQQGNLAMYMQHNSHENEGWACQVCVYVKYDLRCFWARCSPAAECSFSHFRPRGKLACHGYIMKHVWISAELRGGARRIKRRLAGFIWQGIAFRLPETSRSLGNTPNCFSNFDILMNFYNFLFLVFCS